MMGWLACGAGTVTTYINSPWSNIAHSLQEQEPHLKLEPFETKVSLCTVESEHCSSLLPVTSGSSPAQGLPRSGCEGLLSRGRCSCPWASVCLQITPERGPLSPAEGMKAPGRQDYTSTFQEQESRESTRPQLRKKDLRCKILQRKTHQMAVNSRTQRAVRKSWQVIQSFHLLALKWTSIITIIFLCSFRHWRLIHVF